MARMLSCPDCGMMFRIEDDVEGAEANCPVCSRILVVPKAEPRADSEAGATERTGSMSPGKPTGGVREGSSAGKGPGPSAPPVFETSPRPSKRRTPAKGDWQLYRPVRRKIDPRVVWLSLAIAAGIVGVAVIVFFIVKLGSTAVEPLPRRQASTARAPSAPQRERPATRRTVPRPVERRPARRAAAPPAAASTPERPEEPGDEQSGSLPEGPLKGEAAATAERIYTAFVRTTIDMSRPGVRAIRQGKALEAEIEGRSFEAVVTAGSSAMVPTPGQIRLQDGLKVRTLNEWALSDDLTIPRGTYLVFSDGQCEVVDYERLRREAAQRDFYIGEARRQIRRAVRTLDWEAAWTALGELKERYPNAPATLALEGDLRTAASGAVIEVVNVAGHPVTVRIEQAGEKLFEADLDMYERALVELERGNYTVYYGRARNLRAEVVPVARSEGWKIAAEVRKGAANQPARWRYLRRESDLEVIGSPELRKRIQAARARRNR